MGFTQLGDFEILRMSTDHIKPGVYLVWPSIASIDQSTDATGLSNLS